MGLPKYKLTRSCGFTLIAILWLICLDILPTNGHISYFGKRRKIELAKKIGAALLFKATKKKFLLPLPFVFPLPIPVFKNYQPVIHDPLFFKHQMIKGHLGGLTGLGGGLG
ncbi:uncharacterized protein LOC141855042 [Brevipalpus obovatus]|uniref:uncharacterized protein LOC141855042 n=1 Tax=Brevipalpus obovatus TaxID=246614 RepID=UPI003D9EA9BD